MTLCVALLFGCNGTKDGYVINGEVPEGVADGEYVYMMDYNDGLVVDSAAVSRSKFVFKGVADSAMARSLVLNNLTVSLILENGTISVDMSDPLSAKGTPLTETYNEYMSKNVELVMQAREQLSNLDISLSEKEKAEKQMQIVNQMFKQLDEIPVAYLEAHPNDVLGAMIFHAWMQNQMEPSAKKFTEASQWVGETVLNFGPNRQIADYYNQMGLTDEGMPYVDFTIENGNPDGSPASLSDYVGKGKYVLVDFWASWCMPCRMEAPVIAEVYNKYKGDRFEVLGVAVWEKRDATLRAIKEDGIAWPQIIDAQSIPTDLYNIQAIPHIILFGPDGTILARKLHGEKLKQKVAEVMKQ